jgi:hypothetical protein
MRAMTWVIGLMLAFGAVPVSAQSASSGSLCQVGKISYCAKYGRSLCIRHNDAADPTSACTAWEQACVECHTAIPTCFGAKRPTAGGKLCSTCSDQWLACMDRIDAAHYKNRGEPPKPGKS